MCFFFRASGNRRNRCTNVRAQLNFSLSVSVLVSAHAEGEGEMLSRGVGVLGEHREAMCLHRTERRSATHTAGS